MGGYIGATAVGLTTTAADVQGDITSTDTTPELILKNTSEEDTEGGREGKITFKGEQSGGEETTLAQIESAHDGTSDDEKGDLIFKTNDGNDGASPTERLRLDSAGDMLLSSPDPSFTITNTTQEDTDGGRESTIVFKGKQSGGEESTLAQIQAEHGGTNDDEKGNLVFKVNDGSDSNSPTEAFRIDSLARGSFGSGTDGVPTGFWNGSSYQPYFAIENNGITAASNYVTLGLLRHTADSEAAQLGFAASRGTTTNSKTIVQSGDSLGTITWQGADGSEYCEGARINITVDGTPGANDMPARMEFYTTADGAQTPTERMRIESDGNMHIAGSLAVGVKDYPYESGNRGYVHIEGSAGALLALEDTGNQSYIFNNGANLEIQNTSNGVITFATNDTERMRIDSSGDLLHGKTSNSDTVGGAMVTYESAESGGRFTATANGSTGGALFLGNSTTGNVALVRCDGDFECINNRYTGFSDERLKENIVDSNSQWDDVKSVRVRKFSWKADELDAPNKLGVIAQELEALGMSSLVSTNEDLNDPEQERKTVAYSILYMKAFKALQEAMTRIETLETQNTTQATQIADLITRVEALEGA